MEEEHPWWLELFCSIVVYSIADWLIKRYDVFHIFH